MQEWGVTCEERKSPTFLAVFECLCLLMSELGSTEHGYEKWWFNLEWSLISIPENCVNSHVNHLQWREYSITIFFHKSKMNRYGFDKNLPWYIHAKTMLTECRPIHFTSVYFFNKPHLIKKHPMLSTGDHRYLSYSYLLKKFIKDNK